MRYLNINLNDYRKVWFTSDWHLGHDKEFLWKPRHNTSRDHHVEVLLDKINEIAGENDLIVHMGDMCLTCTMDEYVKWLTQIKCKNIWSLTGNHDNRFEKLADDLKERVAEMMSNDMIELKLGKNIRDLGMKQVLRITEPQKEKGRKAKRRYITIDHYANQIWYQSHHGAWHLCGHSHGSFPEISPMWKTGKRFDCGVENALKWSGRGQVMFSYEDVKAIMNYKEMSVLDHHNKETT